MPLHQPRKTGGVSLQEERDYVGDNASETTSAQQLQDMIKTELRSQCVELINETTRKLIRSSDTKNSFRLVSGCNSILYESNHSYFPKGI